MNIEELRNKLCLGCMSEKVHDGPCEFCGYICGQAYDVDYLYPGAVLDRRYIIGRCCSYNGESAVYIGFDAQECVKVMIRELMPRGMVSRNHSNMLLNPLTGKATIYKGIAAEFEDLCRTLMSFNGIQGIEQPVNVFHENDTVYAIYRFTNSMTLAEVITRCGGEIQWSTCKKMFLQVLNTLASIHKKGLIHAGISPSTILIDEKGIPYLSGFSTSALRSQASGLPEPELFDGYSAPEQYENRHRYGDWTDVYSLAAVLYRTITGTMPPNPQIRKLGDNLVDAAILDSRIPQNVSDAIRDAMWLSTEKRTRSADAFSAKLLDCPESDTAIYDRGVIASSGPQAEELEKLTEVIPPDKRAMRQDRRALKRAARQSMQETKKQNQKRSRSIVTVLVPMLLTTAVLGSVVYYLFNSYLPNLKETESSQASIPEGLTVEEDKTSVPDFVGQIVDKVLSNPNYGIDFQFTTKYEYNDDYPKGVIFKQFPVEETEVSERTEVTLYVSDGTDKVTLPNLAGSTVVLAQQTLEGLGLKFRVVTVENEAYTEGLVAYTDPAANSLIKKESEITIYTKKIKEVSSGESKPEEDIKENSQATGPRKVIRDPETGEVIRYEEVRKNESKK